MYALDVSANALVETSVTVVRSAKRECIAAGLGGGDTLRCTPNHPLYDPEEGVYAPASDWIEGRRGRLLRVTRDGSAQEISVQDKVVHSGVFEVFDLSVESEHRNYVAGGVLVHNKTFDDSVSTSLSGTISGTGGDTDSTGSLSSTVGDTGVDTSGSSGGVGSSGTAASSSGTSGSSSGSSSGSGSGGSEEESGSSGTAGSSGTG